MELLQPFQYEFFLHGVIVAILVGAINGILGIYIILRGMSYIGHALSHSIFGGVMVSYLINLNLYIGATIWGIASSIIMNEISKRNNIKLDAIINIISSTGFAIGVFLLSIRKSFIINFEALLFGNILGIRDIDLFMIIIISIISFIFFFLFNKVMLFTIFDKESAKVYGIRTDIVEFIFSIIIAIVVIASIYVIGVTLLAAAITAPAISARLLTKSLSKMIFFSIIIGASTSFIGMYVSFIFNSSSGATIVLLDVLVFALVLLSSFLYKTYNKY